jgi:signal transduction histidine kinase
VIREFLDQLNHISRAARALQTEREGTLNVEQERITNLIASAAASMSEMVVSFPEDMSASAQEVFSFEARSSLATIIGYSELLLEAIDGTLNEDQRQYVRDIRTAGSKMLGILVRAVDQAAP